VPEVTSIEIPSTGLRDRVAVLTEEGLELESRVLDFAREAGDVGYAFDAEAEALDDLALERAAVRCGLGVLHALVERMADALTDLAEPACDRRAAA
jgi:hypothetical protein